jgi:malonyl CoA-acyl carrier protein transacylase
MLEREAARRDFEVVVSGKESAIRRAVRKLARSDKEIRELIVPERDMEVARQIVESLGQEIAIQNLSGTKRIGNCTQAQE